MRNKAHWQALYDAMRTALDDADHEGVPIYHATSIDTQTGEGEVAPFIVYRQDVERSLGTFGGSELGDLSSGWVITSYAFDLEDGLDYLSLIQTALADSVLITGDGYITTGFEVIGVQTIYEDEYKVYGTHLRVLWHRSDLGYFQADPIEDVSLFGTWDDVDGGNGDGDLFDELGGLYPGDSYIRAEFTASTPALYEVKFGPLQDPGTDEGVKLYFRSEDIGFLVGDGSGVYGQINLYQGADLVSTQLPSSNGGWYTQEIDFAPASIAQITDWEDLRLVISLASGPNLVGTQYRKIAWVVLRVPKT